MTDQSKEYVFEVRFKGIEFSEAQQLSVSAAVRKAAMLELAKMDFRNEFIISYPSGRGPLDGIEAVVKPLGQ